MSCNCFYKNKSMTFQEAYNFIAKVNFTPSGTWADLGAGSGTFTIPISNYLGKNGKVYAIDADSQVLKLNQKTSSNNQASIFPIQADFTESLDLPPLDGIFLGNSLHYVKDQSSFLQQLISKLKT